MQAIEITGQTSCNWVVEKAMAEVIESVKSGGSIAAPLREATIFPSMVAQMIAVGEETGNLDTMLTKVADFYEDEVAAAIKALTSILEPIMIVLVGGIVGFIVIAMYMPMFKVYDAIKERRCSVRGDLSVSAMRCTLSSPAIKALTTSAMMSTSESPISIT